MPEGSARNACFAVSSSEFAIAKSPQPCNPFVAPSPPIDAARSHCISRPRARGLPCRIRMTKSRAARLFEQNFSRARLPPQYAQRARSQPAIMQKMSVLQGVLQKRVAGLVSVKNFWMGSQVMLPATRTEHEHTRALYMGRGNEGQSSLGSCRSRPVHTVRQTSDVTPTCDAAHAA